MKYQDGSIFIWAIFVGLIILISAGFLYFLNNQPQPSASLSTEDAATEEQIISVPQSSPDYSQARQEYNLDNKQVEILSQVISDDKL